jgi:hypothetical protein
MSVDLGGRILNLVFRFVLPLSGNHDAFTIYALLALLAKYRCLVEAGQLTPEALLRLLNEAKRVRQKADALLPVTNGELAAGATASHL